MMDLRSTRIIMTLLHDLEQGGDLDAFTYTYVIMPLVEEKKSVRLLRHQHNFNFATLLINETMNAWGESLGLF